MPRKKRKFVTAQRFFKRHGLFFSALFTMLNIILFILPFIVGQEFVILKTVTVHYINLDVKDAYAHPSDSMRVSSSLTVTVQNASGTYILHGN